MMTIEQDRGGKMKKVWSLLPTRDETTYWMDPGQFSVYFPEVIREFGAGENDVLFVYVRSHGFTRVEDHVEQIPDGQQANKMVTVFVAPDGSEIEFESFVDKLTQVTRAGTLVFLVEGCYSSYMGRILAQMENVKNRNIFFVSSSFGSSVVTPADEVYIGKDTDGQGKRGSYFFDVLLAELGRLLKDGGKLDHLVDSVGRRISRRIPLSYTGTVRRVRVQTDPRGQQQLTGLPSLQRQVQKTAGTAAQQQRSGSRTGQPPRGQQQLTGLPSLQLPAQQREGTAAQQQRLDSPTVQPPRVWEQLTGLPSLPEVGTLTGIPEDSENEGGIVPFCSRTTVKWKTQTSTKRLSSGVHRIGTGRRKQKQVRGARSGRHCHKKCRKLRKTRFRRTRRHVKKR